VEWCEVLEGVDHVFGLVHVYQHPVLAHLFCQL
jgi:hypothetical protein